MLTGESVPIEAGAGVKTFAGALVRRGEATAEVTATGARTKFGRTAELVRTAHVVSAQQKAVLRVVRNLAICNGIIIVALVIYAVLRGMGLPEIIPLVLTAVLASIPVALPATFTLAAALGARPSPNWASCRPVFRRSMRPRRWTFCAPTRPAR
jgi:H+-transporting ATPase